MLTARDNAGRLGGLCGTAKPSCDLLYKDGVSCGDNEYIPPPAYKTTSVENEPTQFIESWRLVLILCKFLQYLMHVVTRILSKVCIKGIKTMISFTRFSNSLIVVTI